MPAAAGGKDGTSSIRSRLHGRGGGGSDPPDGDGRVVRAAGGEYGVGGRGHVVALGDVAAAVDVDVDLHGVALLGVDGAGGDVSAVP